MTATPSASRPSELAYRAITPRFGAELPAGQQLTAFTDEQLEALQQLAAERGVVLVRGQDMTTDEQAAFAHRLGEPLVTPMNRGRYPEELIVIKADENSRGAAGTGWHSDVSSEEIPPGLSMLRMEQVPSSGGDTLFADMYQAYESLSEPMQQFLLGLRARHDPKGHYLYLSGAKKLHELPSASHPAIRVHPRTGRPALYVNSGFVGAIEDLTPRESEALLNLLYDHVAYNVAAQIRVQWEPGTAVFWDNRVVQHHAAFDYFPETRRGYRITIRGEAVIPAC